MNGVAFGQAAQSHVHLPPYVPGQSNPVLVLNGIESARVSRPSTEVYTSGTEVRPFVSTEQIATPTTPVQIQTTIVQQPAPQVKPIDAHPKVVARPQISQTLRANQPPGSDGPREVTVRVQVDEAKPSDVDLRRRSGPNPPAANSDHPRGDQPRGDQPRGDQPRGDRPRGGDQPRVDQPRIDRPNREEARGDDRGPSRDGQRRSPVTDAPSASGQPDRMHGNPVPRGMGPDSRGFPGPFHQGMPGRPEAGPPQPAPGFPMPPSGYPEGLLESELVQKMLKLMEKNLELEASMKIREIELATKMKISEIEISHMREKATTMLAKAEEMQKHAEDAQRETEKKMHHAHEMQERMELEKREFLENAERRMAEAKAMLHFAERSPEGRAREMEEEMRKIQERAERATQEMREELERANQGKLELEHRARSLEAKLEEMDKALDIAKQQISEMKNAAKKHAEDSEVKKKEAEAKRKKDAKSSPPKKS